MDNHPIFNTVHQYLSQGDTGQALSLLIAHVETAGTRPDALHTLRVIEANFNAVRQQEIKGILTFSEAQREYARSNDALLHILEDLISGRKPHPVLNGTGDGGSRNPAMRWWIGGILLLALLAFAYYSTQKPKPEAAANCPNFNADGYKVLVFEFQKLSGEASRPELGIQSLIRDLTERNQVNTDVKILDAKTFNEITPSSAEATAFGKNCMADMVIWGQYEKVQDSIVVDIHYAFSDPNWPPGAAINTFKNLSELKTDQMKTTDLTEAVFRLCTAMALRQNRVDLADKWLQKLKNPNAREKAWMER